VADIAVVSCLNRHASLGKLVQTAKFAKERAKRAHYALHVHATSETKNRRNAEIGKNIHVAHGVRIMSELFVFVLCSALIFNYGKKLAPNRQIVKKTFFSTRTLAPRIRRNSVYVTPPPNGFYTRFLRLCEVLRTL